MVMSEDDARAELGRLVRRRRERLGMTIDEAAEEGVTSPVTWSRVEHGKKVRRLSYSTVDRVLRWPEGACLDFLEKDIEPQPVGTEARSDEPQSIEESIRIIREVNDRLEADPELARAVLEMLRRSAGQAGKKSAKPEEAEPGHDHEETA